MKRVPVGYLALVLMSAGAVSGGAAEKVTLKVGDAAPKLRVSKWVQGEPVKEFERGKAYIVEFWATWCVPCRVSIPHLNDIYNKYKDKGLVVIGQDCSERNVEEVPKFVRNMGKKMSYRVALDDMEGSERGWMAETWMAAAGQNGIPSAFVVDKQGKVAWIGHPMNLKEQLLDQVLAGTFDLQKAAAAYAIRVKNEAQIHELWVKLSGNVRNKEWENAEATLGEIEKLMPEEDRGDLDLTRFNLCIGKKDYAAAFKLARRVSDANPDQAMVQNELAWAIATMKDAGERDLELAELCATRANKAAHNSNPGILDTLARVMFLKGEKNKALELQQEAIDLAQGSMKNQLRKVLESYKAGKVPED